LLDVQRERRVPKGNDYEEEMETEERKMGEEFIKKVDLVGV